MSRLTVQEQQEIIGYIEADKLLPDKFRFLLFEDKREIELVWSGKSSEVSSIVLPFQDWMAPIRRVATLAAPPHLTQLREHSVLRHAGFVRGSMRGRYRATEYWPDLYTLIVGTNTSLEKRLRSFEPDRLP